MTTYKLFSSLALALAMAAPACTDESTRGTYSQNLAVCVAVEETAPIAKLADSAAPDTLAPAPAPTPVPPTGEPPTGSTTPGDPHMTCCTNPDGCVDHDYPPETCEQAVAGVTGEIHTLSGGVQIAYDGTDPVNALFGGCEQEECEGQPAQRFTFDLAGTNSEYVISVTDANTLTLYHVPLGARGGKVRAPDGAALHPVLAANHIFANHDRPVYDSNGVLLGYIQNQSDCFDLGGVPTEGAPPASECVAEDWYCLVC
jgi:hypothetical protein